MYPQPMLKVLGMGKLRILRSPVHGSHQHGHNEGINARFDQSTVAFRYTN